VKTEEDSSSFPGKGKKASVRENRGEERRKRIEI
jgi:hypothetical protein